MRDAAELPVLSVRQARRLRAAYRREGAAALAQAQGNHLVTEAPRLK